MTADVNGAKSIRSLGKTAALCGGLLALTGLGLVWSVQSHAIGHFMPHGYCYLWDPKLVWLNVISDGLIALSYYCIPIVLAYFALKNRDLPLNRIFWMFAAFILACGTTHLLEVWNIWHASYLLAGVTKAITACVSLLTVAMIVPLVPRAVLMPQIVDLLETNRALADRVAEHERQEAALNEAPLQRSLANLSLSTLGVIIGTGLVAAVLLALGRRVYPDFHTVVDTCMFVLSGLLALLLSDIGSRSERPFPKWIAASFAVTALAQLAHVLSSLPLSASIARIEQGADLRPMTWPPPAYLLPAALLAAIWMLRRGARWTWRFPAATAAAAVGMLWLFSHVPRFVDPPWMEISRPALLGVPVLWIAVIVICRQPRNTDRLFPPLAAMASMFLLGNVAMLFSRSPHDGLALLAHLGQVGGSLTLLLSVMQLASIDMIERIRTQQQLARINDELEHRVTERTMELEGINRSLEKEISARAEVEEHLRRVERRLMGVIGSAMDAIITLDAQHNIVLFNQAAENMFGYRSGDVLGKPLDRLLPARFRGQHAGHIGHFAKTGVTTRIMGMGAVWGLRSNGDEFPIEASISQVENGEAKLFTVILRDITERLEQDKYSAQLAAIVDSSEDAILSKDMRGIIVSWNKGAEKLFGYTAAEVIGRAATIIIPVGLHHEEKEFLAEVAAGRVVRRDETTRRRKDGTVFQVSVVVSPVRNTHGQIVGASSISHDVSAQHEMREALQTSEVRYHQLFESSGNAIATHEMLFDSQGKPCDYLTLDVNPAFERMTGLRRDQVINRRILEVLPDLERYWIDLFGKVVETGEPAVCDHFASPLGRYFEGSAFRTGPGRFAVSVWDVTERKRAEQKLAEQARVLDLATVLVQGMDSRIMLWTQGAERLYGYSASEALGRVSHELLQTQFPESLQQLVASLDDTGKWEGELVHRKKDGTKVVVASLQLLYRDEQGHAQRIMEANADITARKEAELAAHAYTEDLRRSNAELEQFAYVASHDLQEPLRMVASYTELLAERYRDKLDERGEKYISYAVDGARRMQILIHDLLAYARVSSQAKPLQPTDSGAVLDSVMAHLRSVIEKNQAKVTCGKLPIVNADEVQLGQVFQNLIANAIKFHGDKPPRVEIRADAEGDDWSFAIADDGIGIDKEHGSRLFQMFQRLHTREEYEGSGIGLAISKRIVERHGGRIWFDSTPGGGTTFHFTIPKNGEKQ